MSRRKFDRQFKIGAVKLVQQSGYSRAEAANSLGVTTSHISGWIKRVGALGGGQAGGRWRVDCGASGVA